MNKKFLLVGVLAVSGLVLFQASVQARADISSIRSPRGIQDILCERFNSRWLASPSCIAPAPPAEPQCGNGVVENGEECDGSAPAGFTCNNQCELVAEAPAAECGNNIVENGEECDGNAPAGYICTNSCLLEEIIIEPQIVTYGYAALDSSQVVPPVETGGVGTAAFWLDDQNNLYYDITLSGLTSNLAGVYFRGPAPEGANAGILNDISNSFIGNHADGVWENLGSDRLNYFLAGEMYLTVHTIAYPEGEIRGQIYTGDMGVIILRDTNEIPPVSEGAMGTGVVKWVENSDDLWFHMTTTNATGSFTAAHFHGPATAEQNAEPLFDISFFVTGEHLEGNWTGVSQVNKINLVNDLVYVNLHTDGYPTGELRGQVVGLPAPAVDLEQLVINEVYADVDDEHGEEKTNEWIELYNNGDTTVNLMDWIIDDSEEASDIIQEEVMVAPGEFALISQATSTFEVYWSGQIPNGTHLVVLDSPIGSGLANSGDALILKSGDGIIDAMSYGNDSSSFVLSAAGAGKSLSRNPNGKDTNTANDWVELDTPTPGY